MLNVLWIPSVHFSKFWAGAEMIERGPLKLPESSLRPRGGANNDSIIQYSHLFYQYPQNILCIFYKFGYRIKIIMWEWVIYTYVDKILTQGQTVNGAQYFADHTMSVQCSAVMSKHSKLIFAEKLCDLTHQSPQWRTFNLVTIKL